MDRHIRCAKWLVALLDTKFSLFEVRFGIDPLLDIIPGFGSLIGSVTSCYLFWLAYKLQVPLKIYFRMVVNVVTDFVLGTIPAIGIVFDIFYRSNYKNLALLEPYFRENVLEGEFTEK